ncbi:ubiquitin-conjugating enzyme E2 G1-like [Orbicella faveolata]|uniref:ubiquitin-conjugating enzyme E2 G1-like n=1 Tax=Orbicella faveolata TaxID=48498 RepID=UPI0009E4D8CA|nr:ubiquitin-conjugating enzyme E2 G1-like [Orbicella faveolata]
MSAEQQGALLLKRQLKELTKNPTEGFSAGLIDDDNLFKWELMVVGPPDTFYEGGLFKAHLYFPKEYPQRPPKMRFISDFWHPNGKFVTTWHDFSNACTFPLHVVLSLCFVPR